jgi:hypothetical protein
LAGLPAGRKSTYDAASGDDVRALPIDDPTDQTIHSLVFGAMPTRCGTASGR